jgi:hypothetical protein
VYEPVNSSRIELDDHFVREPTNGTKETRTKSAEYSMKIFGKLCRSNFVCATASCQRFTSQSCIHVYKITNKFKPCFTLLLFPRIGELGLALGVNIQSESAHTEAVSRVCQLAKVPFQDTYVAAFAVLRMVAAQDSEWGLRALFSAPDFLSLMTDGTLPLSNLGVQWRFGVMDAVARNPNRHILHTAGVWNIVKRYVKAGPFRAVALTPEAAVHDGLA